MSGTAVRDETTWGLTPVPGETTWGYVTAPDFVHGSVERPGCCYWCHNGVSAADVAGTWALASTLPPALVRQVRDELRAAGKDPANAPIIAGRRYQRRVSQFTYSPKVGI